MASAGVFGFFTCSSSVKSRNIGTSNARAIFSSASAKLSARLRGRIHTKLRGPCCRRVMRFQPELLQLAGQPESCECRHCDSDIETAAVAIIDSSGRDFGWSSLVLFVFAGGFWGFLGRRLRAACRENPAWNPASAELFPIAALLLVLTLSWCGGAGGGSSLTGGSLPPPRPPPPPVTVSFTVQAASPLLTVHAGQITIQVN